ncbi:phospholipase D-like protein [Cupriavidus phytorum]|uniref:Phospholipase D-like protein n=1 Tax=Cupriavidus phytorum TaxID=3024399 RepID=A0A2W7QNA4_9BURK|nr:phospholipase D family protein [Cupriavidus alkaliphilus]PZX25405.1 phospholipase D-like protein [Cupriavidus alkaliphilus]
MLTLIAQPDHDFRLGDFLTSEFNNSKWTEFQAAIAFAKKSGTQYIKPGLEKFAKNATVRISVGIDHGGTSREAVLDLLEAIQPNGEMWVYKNAANTFHPKVYLFRNDAEAVVVVGSGNLTKGGLYENSEVCVQIHLNFGNAEDCRFFDSIQEILNKWSQHTPHICLLLDEQLINRLGESGELPTEAEASSAIGQSKKSLSSGKDSNKSPFKSLAVPAAPTPSNGALKNGAPASPTKSSKSLPGQVPTPVVVNANVNGTPSVTFAMTLQTTDVGVGQTTKGAQQRSPEVFIPLRALDLKPSFWGWQSPFIPDPAKYKVDAQWRAKPKNAAWIKSESAKANRVARPLEKLDWQNVRIRLAGHAGDLQATLWFNPQKKDIRIRESTIRASGNVDDIFLLRSAPAGSLHTYELEIIKKGTPQYAQILPKLTVRISNSKKRIGYL